MKRVIGFTAAILLFSISCFGQNHLFLSGGISIPSSPKTFSDYWNLGVGFGGGIDFPLSSNLSITASVEYNNFGFNESGFLNDYGISGLGISVTGGSAHIFTVQGGIKVMLVSTPNVIAPYLIGTIGFLNLSATDIKVSYAGTSVSVSAESESAFSFNAGIGVKIPACENMDVFIEGRYAMGFTNYESTSYIPFRLGLSFKI
jgi:opacity protein-like surface antigen